MITIDLFVVHFVLAVTLYLIINWIGEHSYSIGYASISVIARQKDAPAFNFLVRVLGPIVFIILASALIYAFKLDKYVYNIYFVNIYYVSLRLIWSITNKRYLLINWYRQTFYFLCILWLSYLLYNKFIILNKSLLPDFGNMSNEIWIIIIVYLYQIFNNINIEKDASYVRRKRYIVSKFKTFKSLYGRNIESYLNNVGLEILVYSILVHEDFNRPKEVRLLERIKLLISNSSHTLGVMQVKTDKNIDDYQSVMLGIRKIKNDYRLVLSDYNSMSEDQKEYYGEGNLRYDIIERYNSGVNYFNDVDEIYTIIKDTFFKKQDDILLPIK